MCEKTLPAFQMARPLAFLIGIISGKIDNLRAHKVEVEGIWDAPLCWSGTLQEWNPGGTQLMVEPA